MDELEERQRTLALELAVKLAHNAVDSGDETVSKARKFYGFLSGDRDATPQPGKYTLIQDPNAY